MLIMRLAIGQVTVIMVLVDDHDRRRAINYIPSFLARLVNHPVVPASATDGEVGNFALTGLGEEEKIAARGSMESALAADGRP